MDSKIICDYCKEQTFDTVQICIRCREYIENELLPLEEALAAAKAEIAYLRGLQEGTA
jgi:hypothetical protein